MMEEWTVSKIIDIYSIFNTEHYFFRGILYKNYIYIYIYSKIYIRNNQSYTISLLVFIKVIWNSNNKNNINYFKLFYHFHYLVNFNGGDAFRHAYLKCE